MSASIKIARRPPPPAPVGGGVSERHPHVLGLGAVDPVAKDPPSPAEALAESGRPTEAARTARRDARDEHPVAHLDRLDTGADGLDRPYRLMPEDPTVRHRGNVSLEDVQIGAADRRLDDLHNGVGRRFDLGAGRPQASARSWYTSAFMKEPPGRHAVNDETESQEEEAKVTRIVPWMSPTNHIM
jgi:hypothetical protein